MPGKTIHAAGQSQGGETQRGSPKVYLAGPGVFRPDAKAYGKLLKGKCERVGLSGLFPLDNEIADGTPEQIAERIYRANIELIDVADAIIADISPFRSPNMDPGTAWEIGYGAAKGLPVIGWTSDQSTLFARTQTFAGHRNPTDEKGWSIENFGLIENLMIAHACVSVFGDEDEAIAACAAILLKA
jgi:nucleoside 2-deoxyribosyltransferase